MLAFAFTKHVAAYLVMSTPLQCRARTRSSRSHDKARTQGPPTLMAGRHTLPPSKGAGASSSGRSSHSSDPEAAAAAAAAAPAPLIVPPTVG